ncbi:MAG: c-type cytochrome [Gemmatimonadetes bacterium]|nr:c-type cytochrome [Gemmatimonadota bacterium]
MWRTNLKVAFVVLGTLAVYTVVANAIPQVESDVPTELTLRADVTGDELVAAGEQIYAGAGGCTVCHGLGTRAPDVLRVAGRVCAERKPELECKAYLYESLTDPGAYVVEGFQPIMPDMRRTLSNQQIWATVAFLESQGGEVTVTAEDIGTGEEGGTVDAGGGAVTLADGSGSAFATGASDPVGLLQEAACTACHILDGLGGPIGPAFDSMGDLETDYIRRSILNPAADTARGYEALAGTMPVTFGDQFSAAQLEAIVQFLADRP